MGDAPQALTFQQSLDNAIQRFHARDYVGAEQIARQILKAKSDSIGNYSAQWKNRLVTVQIALDLFQYKEKARSLHW